MGLFQKNLLFASLYIACSSPMIFFAMGLPMVLFMQGFDAKIIGLSQLAMIPSVVKFLYSAPIDKFRFSSSHYKKWVAIAGLLYAFSLLVIGRFELKDSVELIFAFIFISNILQSFFDIAINALSIKIFLPHERLSAGGYKISSLFIAGIFGGGLFLLFYNHFGWANTLSLLALMLVLSLSVLLFLVENDEFVANQKVNFKEMLSFFKQSGIKIWVFILCFYFAFISAIFTFLKPYLLTQGMQADKVALYVGIYGGLIGAVASLGLEKIAKKLSKKSMLLAFQTLSIVSIFALFLVEFLDLKHFAYFFIIISLVSISIAFSSGVIFSIVMDYSRKNLRATDYAVQSSIFSITRILSAVVAGFLVKHFSYANMFLFESLASMVVLWVIFSFYKK